MAMTYEWIWGPMAVQDIDDLKGVVTGIQWICLGRDEGNQEMISKQSGLMAAPTPDPANYVTVDKLTAEMVNNWIATCMDKNTVEQECAAMLEQMLSPTTKPVPMPGSNS